MLEGAQGTLVAFFVGMGCLVAGMGTLDVLSALHTAYERARMQLEDEVWLLTNCKDPVFFSKMRSYTNICSEVEARARVGPAWTALRSVSDSFRTSLQPVLVQALCACVGTVLVLPSCCALLFSRRRLPRDSFRGRLLCMPRCGLSCGAADDAEGGQRLRAVKQA
jgi:hypothetical protein